MKATICDGPKCGKVIEEQTPQEEQTWTTEQAELTIRMTITKDLCPACIRKARYDVARQAFESLMNRQAKKPAAKPSEEQQAAKPSEEQQAAKPSEEQQAAKKPAGKPSAAK